MKLNTTDETPCKEIYIAPHWKVYSATEGVTRETAYWKVYSATEKVTRETAYSTFYAATYAPTYRTTAPAILVFLKGQS